MHTRQLLIFRYRGAIEALIDEGHLYTTLDELVRVIRQIDYLRAALTLPHSIARPHYLEQRIVSTEFVL
jgi:hypothetical protein